MTADDGALAATALAAFAAVAAIGTYVMGRPRTRLDMEGLTLRGRGTPLAVVFTRSGYWPTLSAIWVALLGISMALHVERLFVFALAPTQLLAQLLADRLKRIVRRRRPDDWLFHEELGFSFPSGHSTTAVVFYGGLILFVWGLPLPDAVHAIATGVIAVWIVGIPWSRLVLTAHYATDVLAGAFFGTGTLALMVLALHHIPSISRSG